MIACDSPLCLPWPRQGVQFCLPGSSVLFSDASTVSEAGLGEGDRLVALMPPVCTELELLLERDGQEDLPFICQPEESFLMLKQRLGLPLVCEKPLS